MIELKNVRGGYDGTTVVQDISTRFEDHALNILIGPNGCGKSTLMRIAAGLLEPDSGQVLLDGKDIRDIRPHLLAQQVAYLPQSRNMHTIAVQKLVLHGRFPRLGYPRRYRREDIAAAREAMCQMKIEHLADQYVDTLSGGERQKVYIAMMLAQGGEVVFMDEPTTFLDIGHQLEVMGIARELKAMGKTLVVIIHDLNLAMRYADQLFLMDRGRICCQGVVQEVFASGMIDEVFGVSSNCIQVSEHEFQYFFSSKGEYVHV